MVAFALKNQISYSSNLFTKIFHRSTTGLDPSSEIVNNPLLDGIYFGYTK